MGRPATTSILFVCTGNICRSPMAQGICERLLAQRGASGSVCDSAGTHGYREGCAPHPLAIDALARRGIDISAQQCRLIEGRDFRRFEHILAMDKSNLAYLQYVAPPAYRDKARLLMSYVEGESEEEIPDPFGAAREDFERVCGIIERGVQALLDRVYGEWGAAAPGRGDDQRSR